MSDELIKKGKLFKEGKVFSEYAYFGWGEEEAQFYVYSEGYKKSGDILIEQGLQSNDHNLKDKLVFPIIFSYRQYLELIMKHLFIEYSHLSREEKESKINKTEHSLVRIWNCLKPIIEEYTSDDEMKCLDILQEYITEFHNYDTKGDAFRYPVNRQLNLHHEDWTYLDLVNLGDRMDEIYNFFTIIDLCISEKRKEESEFYD